MSTAISRSIGSARSKFSQADIDAQEDMARFYAEPAGFVLFAFPWGVPGTRLAHQSGPDQWQLDILNAIGDAVKQGYQLADALPVLIAVASGHGIGKTALIAWIILWFMATREHPEIIVTAGKREQLSGKTWRELAKWHKLFIFQHWFHWTQTKLEHVMHPDTWFAHAIAWSKQAPENFAGTHEEHVLMIYDEASAIDDAIWESSEGAMTTPGAMWIAFGNPTKTTGRFAQCFGRLKHRWLNRHVDSRTAKMANKAQLQRWVDDYGEDSDFVRVRVRGVFPRAGSLQFISVDEYTAATKRDYEETVYGVFGKVLSVDVARHGDDQSVICRRQGKKVHPLERLRIPDLMQLARRVAEAIDDFQPDAVFIDATGMGWGVVDKLHEMGYTKVIGVQTGEDAYEPERFRRLRDQLWHLMREWIRAGGALPVDTELEMELTEPEYGFDDRQRYVLEKKEDMKERGLASPDGADALALSFTAPVAPTKQKQRSRLDALRKRARDRRHGTTPMAA